MPFKYLLECTEIGYYKILLITKFTDNKRNMYIVQTCWSVLYCCQLYCSCNNDGQALFVCLGGGWGERGDSMVTCTLLYLNLLLYPYEWGLSGDYIAITLFVRPSVCPSVHTVVKDVSAATGRNDTNTQTRPDHRCYTSNITDSSIAHFNMSEQCTYFVCYL
jgi:hypothetical protein